MENIKKFEDFLDKMRGLLDEANRQGRIIVRVEDLERTFPELKEFEDEKVRKALIEMVHDTTGDSLWIDYNVHKSDAIAWLEKQGKTTDIDPVFSYNNLVTKKQDGIDNCPLECSTNTVMTDSKKNQVEPRFKVGDWVVLSTSDGEKVVQIDSIEHFKSGEPRYITSEGRWFGNGTKARLLTDKDVETITLPESKIIVKQKPAWSKEEEVKINRIVACLENLNVADNDILLKDVDWLKSLKERCTWKPSDKQIHAFEQVYDWYNDNFAPSETLTSLYNDLKKLMEE